ncbi:MAG: hydantoinase/oxoprolinase family protein [Pseudomonadota bacterium]
MSLTCQIAVDIGGTFTDGVLLQQRGDGLFPIVVGKALTTPDDPGDAIETVVKQLLAQIDEPIDVRRVVHGTTLVANTLVERRGARAAMVLTTGTLDALDIRRELRYDIYDLRATYPAALIPREDRYVTTARLAPNGDEWAPLDPDELAQIVEAIKAGNYDAVAVCLLHAPVDDRHERAVATALREALAPLPVSVSAEIAREIGEYERMSTAAANAYVQPVVMQYLATLEERLTRLNAGGTLDIMLSNGAFTRAAQAAAAPIRILESGPAGGVQSAVNCGLEAGINRVLAFDMGGTTAKACVAVDGAPEITHVFEFGRVQRFKLGSGLPAVTPSMDLIEIGAGGGSLANINALGLMQVGPQSAGSVPGPACYGLGGEQATVTDADLVLGYLDAETFLGGTMHLDTEKARAALGKAGALLGLDVDATAWGIHDIVNENMASAARTHIAEKGLDARDFTLVATGGAGPVHAVDVARRLRIRKILCPIASGVGSCLGFLSAPARADRSWSKVEPLHTMDLADFGKRIEAAAASARADLTDCGLAEDDIRWRLTAEVRYGGQGNTVAATVSESAPGTVDPAAVLAAFEAEYLRLYRKLIEGGVPEVVTWRLSGASDANVMRFELANAAPDARPVEREIYLPATRSRAPVPVYQRYALKPGTEVAAPAVLVEPESTLVVAYPGTVTVLDSGTVQVDLEG